MEVAVISLLIWANIVFGMDLPLHHTHTAPFKKKVGEYLLLTNTEWLPWHYCLSFRFYSLHLFFKFKISTNAVGHSDSDSENFMLTLSLLAYCSQTELLVCLSNLRLFLNLVLFGPRLKLWVNEVKRVLSCSALTLQFVKWKMPSGQPDTVIMSLVFGHGNSPLYPPGFLPYFNLDFVQKTQHCGHLK